MRESNNEEEEEEEEEVSPEVARSVCATALLFSRVTEVNRSFIFALRHSTLAFCLCGQRSVPPGPVFSTKILNGSRETKGMSHANHHGFTVSLNTSPGLRSQSSARSPGLRCSSV